MFYDPQYLDTEQRATDSQLAPTLGRVTQESHKIVQEKDDYKSLLKQLAKSDFVKEMHNLRTNIIE